MANDISKDELDVVKSAATEWLDLSEAIATEPLNLTILPNVSTYIPLLIQDAGQHILRIDADGTINYMKDGELVAAETDNDIGLAFANALISLSYTQNDNDASAVFNIKEMVKSKPNDSDLGRSVREYINRIEEQRNQNL